MKEIRLHPRSLRSKRIKLLLRVLKSLGPKGVVIVECKRKDKQGFKSETRRILKRYFPEETFFIYEIPSRPKERTRFLIRPYSRKGLANVGAESTFLPDISEWIGEREGFYERRKDPVLVPINKTRSSKRNPRKAKGDRSRRNG